MREGVKKQTNKQTKQARTDINIREDELSCFQKRQEAYISWINITECLTYAMLKLSLIDLKVI